jgi:hypothetical protein
LAEIWLRMGSERRREIGVVLIRAVLIGVVFRGVVLAYFAEEKRRRCTVGFTIKTDIVALV